MITSFHVFLFIILLFLILLVIKSVIKVDFCVICTSISLSWLTLLALYWFGLFEDTALLALLMGGSAVGIYYLVESKTKKELHIFRLPFLLTLLALFYALLSRTYDAAVLIVGIWIIFALVYIYQGNPLIQRFTKKLIACCKKW